MEERRIWGLGEEILEYWNGGDASISNIYIYILIYYIYISIQYGYKFQSSPRWGASKERKKIVALGRIWIMDKRNLSLGFVLSVTKLLASGLKMTAHTRRIYNMSADR